jgi:flagellar biosynthesis protein FlhB
MEAPQKSDWLKGFMDHLRSLIKEPPYLAFFFVSTTLLIVNFFRPIYFYTFLAIFLYSIFGVMWRHVVKDIRGRLKEAYPNNFTKKNLWLTVVYHFINLIAVFVLVFVIVRYCI